MRYLWLFILFLFLAGCGSDPQQQETGDASQMPGQSEPANLLKGTVLEKMDADHSSYLRLSTESGEIWAAVLQVDVQVGDEVAVASPMPMDGFESKTLNRTFEKIVFGVLYQPGEEDTAQVFMDAHSGVSESASIGPVNLEKAAGPEGRTVAEVFSQSRELKDRKVSVRGIVTKVNSKVLDRNWIHIQDGTGDSQAKTNDLTVTSNASVSVGDTVLVEGIVRTDKNYGMGYVFPVLIEDATVKKQ